MKEKIGATIFVALFFGFYLAAAVMKYGVFDSVTIFLVVMAGLMLVMVWIPEHNKFDAWMTKRVNELCEKRKAQSELRDEEDPGRVERRKKRQEFYNRHFWILLLLATLLEGAGWIWSLKNQYHSSVHTVIFCLTFFAFIYELSEKLKKLAEKSEETAKMKK